VIVVGLGLHLLVPLAGSDDLALVHDAVRSRTGTLTSLARAVSVLGRSAVLVPAAIAIVLAGAAMRRAGRGLPVLATILGAIFIQNVDKAIVARPRPPVTRLEHVTGTSFPSGHATEAAAFFVAVALAVAVGRPRLWVANALAAVIVAAVCVSRVYLGAHYPTDVVAGALLGGGWAAAVSYLSRRQRSASRP
jgi:undecaprenyl-diphosphatase